ncbi:MAG: SRPBCC family protein [Solirubrobacteraceae bacterium]|nr:SRPBCC family protein [Solirubrobacteraceae bacterium]
MLRHEAMSSADPEVAWALLSEPARWREWAPHLRGASGLGSPAVEGSALGVAWLAGLVPVPVRVELVERSAERSHWEWKAGVVHFDHAVRPLPGGRCSVSITLRAPWPLERALAVSYWLLVRVLVDRLARVAEREALVAA